MRKMTACCLESFLIADYVFSHTLMQEAYKYMSTRVPEEWKQEYLRKASEDIRETAQGLKEGEEWLEQHEDEFLASISAIGQESSRKPDQDAPKEAAQNGD